MSKAKNSLLTLACGDAYGSYFEMDGLVGVRFDKAKLPNYAISKRCTDDTQMALMLWKNYNNYKTIKTDELLKAYKKWAEEEGVADGIGIQTANVLLHGKKDKSSQGNGALMRVLPAALKAIDDGMGFGEVLQLMREDASLTHDNSVIHLCNQLALDIALSGLGVLDGEEYRVLLSRLRSGHSAWVIHTLYHVIDVLRMDLDIIDGFKELVSRGGDTDTNCAVYGAIVGYSDEFELNMDDFLTEEWQTKLLESTH